MIAIFSKTKVLRSVEQNFKPHYGRGLQDKSVTLHNYLRVVIYVLKHAMKDKYIQSNLTESTNVKYPDSQSEGPSLLTHNLRHTSGYEEK